MNTELEILCSHLTTTSRVYDRSCEAPDVGESDDPCVMISVVAVIDHKVKQWSR